ncbi:hypothetical protein [Neobacillus cucumis]|uniref:hypothetical protein n=1 Tax=Neobacillus cucumis TaxID=1740721 RepID=UPI0019659BF1|nr:hypothetical protein [Neobacillus cucumis]MBM7653394.1 hypothetical protein [Neobacillus cucumis]
MKKDGLNGQGQVWLENVDSAPVFLQKDCPYGSLIRTRIVPIRAGAVRIRVLFGQELFQKSRSCPNPPSIRTRKAQKFRGLSESPGHSDKDRSKRFEAVRIPVSFGQRRPKRGEDCPNHPPFG